MTKNKVNIYVKVVKEIKRDLEKYDQNLDNNNEDKADPILFVEYCRELVKIHNAHYQEFMKRLEGEVK